MIAQKDIFAKIHPHLADYGFILRYQQDKKNITGYGYEPWHFRYIDDPVTAKEIMDKGIIFEEYKLSPGNVIDITFIKVYLHFTQHVN